MNKPKIIRTLILDHNDALMGAIASRVLTQTLSCGCVSTGPTCKHTAMAPSLKEQLQVGDPTYDAAADVQGSGPSSTLVYR